MSENYFLGTRFISVIKIPRQMGHTKNLQVTKTLFLPTVTPFASHAIQDSAATFKLNTKINKISGA